MKKFNIPITTSFLNTFTHLLCLSIFSINIHADNLSDSNQLFDWAEINFSEYFRPANSETFPIQIYLARYYPETETYLGTFGNEVYVYGDIFNGLLKVGVLNDFIKTAKVFDYKKGIYAIWPVSSPLPIEMLQNKGLTGFFLTAGGKWEDIEPSEGLFSFSLYNERINQASEYGKKIVLAIPHNSAAAPKWLTDQVEQFVTIHKGCEQLVFPTFWDEKFKLAKLKLINALGAQFVENETVVAVTASFAGTKTGDWNIDFSTGECNGVPYDNTIQWLNAGYSTTKMQTIGEEVILTTANAFHNQSIKVSISVSPSDTVDTTKSTLAEKIISYGRTNYPDRFYIQASNLNTNTPLATDPNVINATPSSKRILLKILKDQSPFMGWQLVDKATNPSADCRLGGKVSDCPDTISLMNDVLSIALSYQPSFIEVWQDDGLNSALTNVFIDQSTTLVNSN